MSEQVVQGIADEKLDELADLLAHWQRNRAKGITPRAVRTAIFMSLDETQLVSSLRAQVAALTHDLANEREAEECFRSNAEKAEADRDKYKAEVETLRKAVLKAHEGDAWQVQYSDQPGICVCEICEPLRTQMAEAVQS